MEKHCPQLRYKSFPCRWEVEKKDSVRDVFLRTMYFIIRQVECQKTYRSVQVTDFQLNSSLIVRLHFWGEALLDRLEMCLAFGILANVRLAANQSVYTIDLDSDLQDRNPRPSVVSSHLEGSRHTFCNTVKTTTTSVYRHLPPLMGFW